MKMELYFVRGHLTKIILAIKARSKSLVCKNDIEYKEIHKYITVKLNVILITLNIYDISWKVF